MPANALLFSAGAVTWTLMEYTLHRFAGHENAIGLDLGEKFHKEHIRHHAEKDYFAPTEEKAKAMLSTVAGVGVLSSLLMGPRRGLTYTAGLGAMYLGYEVLHRRLHVAGPKNAYARWARKNHFHHHFNNPKSNHGVTSPVWDYVFGTHEKTDGQVRVPERHAMDWLTDPATGEVKEEYQADYMLRGRRKKKTAAVEEEATAKADLEAALAGVAPG